MHQARALAALALSIAACSAPYVAGEIESNDAGSSGSSEVDSGGAAGEGGSVDTSSSDAARSKVSLLDYLSSQGPANGGGILSGAYVSVYAVNSAGTDPLEIFYHGAPNDASGITLGPSQPGHPTGVDTGLGPAILGFEITTNDGVDLGFPYVTYSTRPYLNSYIAAGGIGLVGGWMYNPVDAGSSTINAENLLHVTSSMEYTRWQHHLEQIAHYFKLVKGTVLYRPLIDPNLEGANWWDRGNFTAAQQVEMYIQEWTYLKTAGVTNVLWVFSATAGVGGYTDAYPGDQYVDIVSMDAHPIGSDAMLGGMYAALTTPGTTSTGISYSGDKPIFFAEAGTTPGGSLAYDTGNWDSSRALVASEMPKVFAITTWFQGEEIGNQNGAQAFMKNTISRTMVPAYQ